MTQQYLVGEFSLLLAGLQPAPSESLTDALDHLRHEVEGGPPTRLPVLAREAMALTDAICWTALQQGDPNGFRRYAGGAAMLHEFADSARLLG